jgi:hypothetical protein
MSNGRHLAPRPGFVLDVDRNSPPIVFHHGEGFKLEKLPTGRSRVILPGLSHSKASPTRTAPSDTPS